MSYYFLEGNSLKIEHIDFFLTDVVEVMCFTHVPPPPPPPATALPPPLVRFPSYRAHHRIAPHRTVEVQQAAEEPSEVLPTPPSRGATGRPRGVRGSRGAAGRRRAVPGFIDTAQQRRSRPPTSRPRFHRHCSVEFRALPLITSVRCFAMIISLGR